MKTGDGSRKGSRRLSRSREAHAGLANASLSSQGLSSLAQHWEKMGPARGTAEYGRASWVAWEGRGRKSAPTPDWPAYRSPVGDWVHRRQSKARPCLAVRDGFSSLDGAARRKEIPPGGPTKARLTWKRHGDGWYTLEALNKMRPSRSS